MSVDVDAVSRLIREIAEREVLPLFKRLADGDVWEKRPGAVVTVADTRAEAGFDAGLRGLLPGSRVVAEEACEEDPGILAELERPGAVWVVDPIDGTANFAEGDPRFAVMVALVRNGETAAGWIYHPVSGSMSVAERGTGAWRDGARLTAAAAAPPEAMTGALRGRIHRALSAEGRFAEVTDNKCCGVDYLALSAGTSHFAFYRSLKALGPRRRTSPPPRGRRLQRMPRRRAVQAGPARRRRRFAAGARPGDLVAPGARRPFGPGNAGLNGGEALPARRQRRRRGARRPDFLAPPPSGGRSGGGSAAHEPRPDVTASNAAMRLAVSVKCWTSPGVRSRPRMGRSR